MSGHWIIIDTESTGLDERAPGAQLLEIALVAVDRRLQEVAHWHSPIKVHRGDFPNCLDPYVLEMHSNSGLMAELRGGRGYTTFEAGGLPTEAEAEAVALQFVAAYGAAPDSRGRPAAIMVGANIGAFDRQWLKARTPRLNAAFHYRSVDSNFTFLSEQFLLGGPTEKGETRHRALDDARQCLGTLRRYFGVKP